MPNLFLKKVIYSPESLFETEKIRLRMPALFKHRPTVKGVTIDGVHSPDLDDAIWVKRTAQGYAIDVHIADVASLIEPDSTLFKESIDKKHSRYYENDGIEHMLPNILAENLFSLLENKTRLTITIRTELNKNLDIINRQLFQSRLTSQKRFSHGDAAQLIREKDNNLGKMLELAFRLSIGLIKKRFSKRSASLMDIEAGIYLDKYGSARALRQSSNNSGSLLIQALMVLSNEMVSHYFMDNQLPGIFRNHLPKTKQEISEIMEKIIQNNGNKPKQEWLDQLNHSFLKAKYDVKNKGHRSLLLDSYLHFTSPIRRAADLVNHMILHAYLNSKPIPFSKKKLRKIAKHLNS